MSDMISYDGYLTEQKLVSVFEQISHDVETQFQVKNYRYKWDLRYKNFLVEFDGSFHYEKVKTLLSDSRKDQVARNHGFEIVRIPYWLQLTPETFSYFFNESCQVRTQYSHGFIDKNASLPANFCGLGIQRFQKELENLRKHQQDVFRDIVDSLNKKIDDLGYLAVLPPQIEDWFHDMNKYI